MSTLKERLLARERPLIHYPLRTSSVQEAQDAENALNFARRVAMATKANDKKAVNAAKREVAKAQERWDACYTKIPLRAMKPADFEALRTAYPESDSDDEKVRLAADEAYLWALFLASVEVEDMTEKEWTAFFDEHVSSGERLELYSAAQAVNGQGRTLDPSVPKG